MSREKKDKQTLLSAQPEIQKHMQCGRKRRYYMIRVPNYT
jgi:hypothetical protein